MSDFTIKEIILMMQQEKEERLKLANELSLTRQYVKKYNGLIEKISVHEERIRALEDKGTEEEGKSMLWDAIRKYSVWIIGLVTFGYWLAQVLGVGR